MYSSRYALLLALAGCESDPGAAMASQPPPEPVPATADVAAPAPEPEKPKLEARTAPDDRPVRQEPSATAAMRGRLGKGEPFYVLERVEGTGCKGEWARVPGDGYVCLDGTTETDEEPATLPRLVRFDPPTPDEYETYVATGVYGRDFDTTEAFLPNIYGKPWRKWKGNLYKDLASYEAGAAPIGRLGRDRKYHFEEVVQTPKGDVIVNDDGRVAAIDDVFLYPVSRHHGRDLEAEPLAEGLWPAWTIAYEGAPLHREPREDSEVGVTLAYHTPVVVKSTPADPTGRWWEIPDGIAPGVPGYVNDWRSIRHPVPHTRPEGVGDDELWVDIELGQQVLHLMKGDRLVFATLVSTGDGDMPTPRGIWRVMDKMASWDMSSRADAEDVYYVEDVPWVAHFKPRYALHGVYWHWGFGRKASHGCVNLAPLDAKYVFDRLSPVLQPGWTETFATADDPGTVVRVRLGTDPVPDKRTPVASAESAGEPLPAQ